MMRRVSLTAHLEHFVVKRLQRAWAAYHDHRAAKRDFQHLSTLRDRELEDIGLTREDVDRVLSQPFDWRDL